MEFFEPEQRIAEQERPHLAAAVVEDQRAPVLVLTLPRIVVLVQRRAVETREAVPVLREMTRHPVENHADSVAMAFVHEVPEIVRRAEPARRREEADHLVAPRPREGMLHDGHQLDVRVTHLAHVRDERVRQLAVGERAVAFLRHAAPRAEVHFVRGLGPIVPAAERLAVADPVVVAPLEAALGPDDRRRIRRDLEVPGVRIRLLQQVSRPACESRTCSRRRPSDPE